jgi:F0F1-type ATP synthase gamma subunit
MMLCVLTLSDKFIRQVMITKELIEIISDAEAL